MPYAEGKNHPTISAWMEYMHPAACIFCSSERAISAVRGSMRVVLATEAHQIVRADGAASKVRDIRHI
jgi:hypothetical protein